VPVDKNSTGIALSRGPTVAERLGFGRVVVVKGTKILETELVVSQICDTGQNGPNTHPTLLQYKYGTLHL